MAIVKVTDSDFDSKIESEDFDGKANILKLDVDENPSTAAKFEVMSIPTLILFKDGEPVDKVVGFQPKENLAEVIEKHL